MDKKTLVWRGLGVEIRESREPAMEPWDGDEPLDPACEGWDLSVEVGLPIDGHTFKAGASVCGNWIMPGRDGFEYLDSQIKELTDEALEELGREIARVASGEDVRREQARQDVAAMVARQ